MNDLDPDSGETRLASASLAEAHRRNFHFGYLLDPENPAERVTAEKLNHDLVSRALALEGT